jgi:TonB family protein
LARGLIVSLLLHSLPLLTLIAWQPPPEEAPTPIPIELVLEQPPPPPPPIPEPPTTTPPMRRASADMAEPTASTAEPGIDSPPEPQPAAEPEAVPAASSPPPEPAPSEAEPQPAAETKTAALTLPPLPKPTPHKQQPPLPTSVPMSSAWPLPLRQERPVAMTRRFATLTGPSAVRDEYCVRALNLTMRHLDLLPHSYLAGRRGRTVLLIRILGDGTINSVKVAQGSGYPDIDQRIEKMVFAVGQYPPLPPRMPGPWMDFSFIMAFPESMQQ